MHKIIHIDADCFFAAIEMRENPILKMQPLAIGGMPDKRGVIATCNYPARAYGVRSAMPSAQALKHCPKLILQKPNMILYKDVSKQMMNLLAKYTNQLEIVSIDEAYLAIETNLSATNIAQKIKQSITQELGIQVSAGIAENKLLAKIASDYNKPNGLTTIHPKHSAEFIAALPVIKIPGVGKKFNQKLAQMGVKYCHQAQALSLDMLIKHFGKAGLMLYQRCRGIDERPIKHKHTLRKSISLEHTFSQDLSAKETVQYLPKLWRDWQQRVIQKNIAYSSLSPFIKLKFADFSQTTYANKTLGTNIEDFTQMLNIASSRSHLNIRLLGIGALIGSNCNKQMSLF